MNDRTCAAGLDARRLANLELGRYNRPLAHYGAADRARIEALSRRFRALDAEITALVNARGAVRAGGSVLVPTRDRLDFVELDAATLAPRAHIESDRANVTGLYFRPPTPHPNGGTDADPGTSSR